MATVARFNGQALDDSGNVITNAKVEVRSNVSGTPLAALFSDRDGSVSLENPFDAESDGSFGFHVAGGAYRIRVYVGDSLSPTFEDIRQYEAIGTNAETDFGTIFLPRGAWSGATTYAQGDLVSHNDGVGDNYAFASNAGSNLNNEPTFDGSNVGQSDSDWTVVGLIEAPGVPGSDGSSDVNATSATSNTIATGSKSFTTVESERGWAVGARLRVTSSATPASDFMEGVVTAYDDATALTVLMDTVPNGAASGPFTDWIINLAGSRGLAGSDPGIFLDWDDGTTDADPGTGKIRADNADLSAATELYISKTDTDGNDVETFLSRMDDSTNTTIKGALTVRRSSDNTVAIFDYGAITDATGYVKLAIVASSHSGATAFTDDDAVSFQPTRNGDKGLDGAGVGDIVGPGSATTGNAILWGNASATSATDAGSPPILNSLVTTRGDLIIRNATVPARLAIGSANSIVGSDGTDVVYFTLVSLIDDIVTPAAATESAGNITFDVENGATSFRTRTLAGNETLLAPTNMPVGWTIYFDVDPDANTLSFHANFIAPTPDVTNRSLIAIVKRATDQFLAVVAHEEE